MIIDTFSLLADQKLLVEVCPKGDGMCSLRPFFFNFFSEQVHIECSRDLSMFNIGDIVEVEVSKMVAVSGDAYLYCS